MNAAGAERVKQHLGDIRVLVCVERTVRAGHLVVAVRGIVHAEAVVVLRREDKIAEADARGEVRPLVRLEAQRIDRPVQVEILPAEQLRVRLPRVILARPVRVAVRQRPAFADSQLRIRPPVHHQRQLLIAEPLQPLAHRRFLRHDVRVFLRMIDNVPAQSLDQFRHAVSSFVRFVLPF